MCEILSSVAENGRADGRTESLGQLVFDVSCSFHSGGLGQHELVMTD